MQKAVCIRSRERYLLRKDNKEKEINRSAKIGTSPIIINKFPTLATKSG